MAAIVTSINDAKSRVRSRTARDLARREMAPPEDAVHVRHFVRKFLEERGQVPGTGAGRHYGIGNGNVKDVVPQGARIFFPVTSGKRHIIHAMLRGPLQSHLEAVEDGGVVFEVPPNTLLTVYDTFHNEETWNTGKHNVVAVFFIDDDHWQLSVSADGRVVIKTLTTR